MRVQPLILWSAAAAVALGISWVTWQGPANTAVPTPPRPLTRAPTPAEQALVDQLAARVLGELRATTARLGRPLRPDELEASDASGRPHLPSGLPDNPLIEGVAGVQEGCDLGAPAGQSLDWIYCPAPLAFSAPLQQYAEPPRE
jgi:hypothetical protein